MNTRQRFERDKRIVAALKDGEEVESIAIRESTGAGTIRRVASEWDIAIPRKTTKGRQWEMAQEVASGANPMDVARKHKVSRGSVYQACARHSVPCRKNYRYASSNSLLVSLVLHCYPEHSMEEIGRACNRTRERVRQVISGLESYGIRVEDYPHKKPISEAAPEAMVEAAT